MAVGRPPKYKSREELSAKIEEYFNKCEGETLLGDDGKPALTNKGYPIRINRCPPTVTGLAYHLGFSTRHAVLGYQKQGKYADIIERAKLRIEAYNEERLYDRDGVRGAMFNLANNYKGWALDPKPEEDNKPESAFYLPAALVARSFADIYRDMSRGKGCEYVFKGGRGSTKSSFVALYIIERLMQHPEQHAVALRQVGATLKDSVYAKICWAITALGLDSEFECKLSPLEIIRKSTKQRIYFRGADDPSKLKSITPPFGYMGVLWFEELDQFRGAEAVRNIEQSVIRGGDNAVVIKTFNPPKTINNWANAYCRTPRDGRIVHHSTYTDVPLEWLGQRFIDDAEYLKSVNPDAYAHEYLGECNGNGGAVFENVTLREITSDERNVFDRIYNGIDWGWYPDPLRFVRAHYAASERRLFIFDELSGNKLANTKIAELLRDKGITDADRITADSGGEGPKSVADLKSMGFFIRGAIKGPGSVEYSMKWLASLVEIVIDPVSCPRTAKEFIEYEYERDRDGEVISAYPDENNHSIDAVRYALEEVWRRKGQ